VALALLVAAPAAGAVTWSVQSVPAPLAPNGQFFSVSCTSATTCMGVGFIINSLAEQRPLAETWNGTSWTKQSVALPSGAPNSLLHGVSCTSASACTAVGGAGSGGFPSQPVAERWNGTSWKLQTVPIPSGAGQVSFSGVSCTSSTACTAVGSYYNGSHSAPLAERWNGTNWAIQTIPEPSGTTNTILNGIACSGTSACIAVGDYTNVSGSFEPNKTLAERWNGTSWTIQATPNPAGTTAAMLTGIACSAATACTAAGGYSTTSTEPNETLAERWNGTSWTIQTTPNPSTGAPLLGGVSCPTSTSCTAVGAPNPGFSETPLVEHWNGTSWAIQTAPSPASSGFAELWTVSCTGVSACTAVGTAGSDSQAPPATLAERWNGTSWAVQTTVNQSGTLPSRLSGVACPSSSTCIGVGEFTHFSGDVTMLAAMWHNSSWSLQSVPGPSTTNGTLNGVSCTAASACTAVGGYLNGFGVRVPLAERWNGTSWVVQSAPSPSGAVSASFNGVSCASATSCVAVGSWIHGSTGHTGRLAERWNGSSWTLQTTPSLAGATFSTLTGVACKSASACTAVGGYSTATNAFQANKLLAEQGNGSSWTITTTPHPAGTMFATFTGVSCSSTTACTAAGGYSTTSGAFPDTPLAERWSGTSWTIQTTTNPSSAGFNGDSCSGSTECTAVGGLGNIFAEGWDGTAWSTQSPAFPSEGSGALLAVSCSAAASCTAAGYTFNNYFLAAFFSDSVQVGVTEVPLAERDPASSSAPAAANGTPPGPAPSIKLLPPENSTPRGTQIAVLATS
jgi:hypothetical protein